MLYRCQYISLKSSNEQVFTYLLISLKSKLLPYPKTFPWVSISYRLKSKLLKTNTKALHKLATAHFLFIHCLPSAQQALRQHFPRTPLLPRPESSAFQTFPTSLSINTMLTLQVHLKGSFLWALHQFPYQNSSQVPSVP